MTNTGEKYIQRKYMKRGWKVIRGGAPDFIAFKKLNSGKTIWMGVEVKRFPKNRQKNTQYAFQKPFDLTKEQRIYRKMFKDNGIKFILVRTDKRLRIKYKSPTECKFCHVKLDKGNRVETEHDKKIYIDDICKKCSEYLRKDTDEHPILPDGL